MAETGRRSGRRKRKLNAATSPIVQLRSGEVCECAECWKTAVLGPFGRRSARLAAKKPQVAAEVSDDDGCEHELQGSKNSFVYELREVKHRYRQSTDGRYLYVFTKRDELLIVDLTRNKQKLLKPQTNWDGDNVVKDYVVVNANTMLAKAFSTRPNNGYGLHLLRFATDTDRYDRFLLHETNGWLSPTFVLTEISGPAVEVKRAVLCNDNDLQLVLLRVDVAAATAIVEHTLERRREQVDAFAAKMSDDGRELYAINGGKATTLDVYSLAQKKWRSEPLDGVNFSLSCHFIGSSRTIYAKGSTYENNTFEVNCLARCDLRRKKWEHVPIDGENLASVSPIVNPPDGEEDGIVLIRSNTGRRRAFYPPLIRIKVERHMFRTTDSLLHHSFIAARKLQEGVEVEQTLHQALEAEAARKAKANGTSSEEPVAVPQKKFFPSLYEGMELIPICRLE